MPEAASLQFEFAHGNRIYRFIGLQLILIKIQRSDRPILMSIIDVKNMSKMKDELTSI